MAHRIDVLEGGRTMTRAGLEQVRAFIEAAVDNLRPDESGAEGFACAELEKADAILAAELAKPEELDWKVVDSKGRKRNGYGIKLRSKKECEEWIESHYKLVDGSFPVYRISAGPWQVAKEEEKVN